MCGIAGFSLSPNANVNSKRLARSLLLSIENRGFDATGFAYLDSTGAFQVHKKDVAASDFVKKRLCLPRKARTAIMHTRFATQGDPFWNDNNHPIATGTVVGVHNGHISNDDALFRDVEELLGLKDIRIGSVDSEAAFAVLGWTNEPVTDVLEALHGTAALAWLDVRTANPETLHLARVSSSPLIVGETYDGSVIFASTQQAVVDACMTVGLDLIKLRDIPEGEYLQVLYGDIENVVHFKPPYSQWEAWSARRRTPRGMAFEMDDYEYGETPPVGKVTYITSPGSGVTDARLAAEEPDFGSEDADDVRYGEWLRLNSAELDRLEAKDLKDDERFESFCAQRWLHAGYLTDPQLPVPTHDSTAMYLADDLNVARETAIEEWASQLNVSNEDVRRTTCVTLKAGVRPGDDVVTELNGCRCEGQIIHTPQTFPLGWYTIRVLLFNEKRDNNREAVYVVRKHFEFQLANVSHTITAPKELNA